MSVKTIDAKSSYISEKGEDINVLEHTRNFVVFTTGDSNVAEVKPRNEALADWNYRDSMFTDFPDSSSVFSVSYSPKSGLLFIVFRSNVEAFYIYKDVPHSVWLRYKDAISAGKFIGHNIVGNYVSTKFTAPNRYGEN